MRKQAQRGPVVCLRSPSWARLAIFGSFRSDLAPLSSHLRSVVKLFSFPERRLGTYGGDLESPLRKDFCTPVPFSFLCSKHETLLLWVWFEDKGFRDWTGEMDPFVSFNGQSPKREKSRPGREFAWPAQMWRRLSIGLLGLMQKDDHIINKELELPRILMTLFPAASHALLLRCSQRPERSRAQSGVNFLSLKRWRAPSST